MTVFCSEKNRTIPLPSAQTTQFKDSQVCQYLLNHPDFFIRYAKALEDVRITHSVRGAISLPEWQMERQRIKIKNLEEEIRSLMSCASHNELLFEHLMGLQLKLFSATSFDDMLLCLKKWAYSLGLRDACLYLCDHKWQISAPSKYHYLAISADKFDFVRIRHLQYQYHYLGQLNQTEMALLFPQGTYQGSVAMSLLGEFGDLGLVIFISRHAEHYQQMQGTLLLEKIRLILPVLIEHWITKK